MKEFDNVKIFTDNVEEAAVEQIKRLADTKMFGDAPIRIMPDCHAGAGCVIGFTAPLGDKLCPNIVGVDLNCGMLCVPLGENEIDLERFDNVVKEEVPSGRNVQKEQSDYVKRLIDSLKCKDELRNKEWLCASAGTLGGGNHFIELDIDEMGCQYLVIHTGSRNLGKQVAEIYQKKAEEQMKHDGVQEVIERLKKEGRTAEIEEAVKAYKKRKPLVPKELSYLTGDLLKDYLHDVEICRRFADDNRKMIAVAILSKYCGISELRAIFIVEEFGFTTLHNYIGKDGIVRKGAISAKDGEQVLIPLNMRDGCILGMGKGNAEWNNSAPHGAGRSMSRAQARKEIQLSDFKETMRGVYSTTVDETTIDEAPFAYKPSEEIVELVKDTVEILAMLKPIYNFKAAE